jgi:hypothetical protein
VPEASAQSKLSRFWLFAPFVLLAIGVVLWSAYWVVSSRALTLAMDAETNRLSEAGYDLSWQVRKVNGYPFRLDVTLLKARLRTPAGWTVSSPRFEAEAFMHSPGHWITAMPQGLAITPPNGGTLAVSGSTLRASFQALERRPPSVSMEGVGLRFKALDPKTPFVLSRAERMELHLRPGPDHQGAVFLRLEGGQPTAGSALGQWAGLQPVSAQADALLNALDQARSASTWTAAGGTIRVRQAMVSAGSITARTQGRLALDPQGHLSGTLPVTLSKGDTILGHQDLLLDAGQLQLSSPAYP